MKSTSDKFRSLLAGLVGGQIQCALNACPDQFVGRVSEYDTTSTDFCERKPVFGSMLATGRAVVLILESPHKDEFVQPIGPAKGKTGELIRRHLSELVPKAWQPSNLILLNAVQHQCSLGHPTKVYRDQVFRIAWDSFGRQSFERRLGELISLHEIYLVNACTRGSKQNTHEPLRSVVERSILSVLGRQSDLHLTHPASWWSKRNRDSRW